MNLELENKVVVVIPVVPTWRPAQEGCRLVGA